MDLAGRYDVIYISNVLEHFADFDAKARVLMKHCQRLCILVPYLELQGDQPLSPDPREHHQHTFDDHSFDFLIQEGLAASIRRQVFSCYGAWGWTWGVRVEQTLKNFVRPWIGKKTMAEPRQILYDITT